MANYYWVKLHNPNLTQEGAAKVFERFYNSLSPEELKQLEDDARKWQEEQEKLPKTTNLANGFNF